MTADDVQSMFKLRFDDAGKTVWMLPQDIIDNTIMAFSVSATSASGYAGASPTGRYFAPANGPDCIEPDNGADFGDCGSRSLVVTGPMFQQHDIRISKRTRIVGRANFEFAAEMLNAFNHAELRAGRRPRQQHRQLRGDRPHGHEHVPRHPAGEPHQLVTGNAEC